MQYNVTLGNITFMLKYNIFSKQNLDCVPKQTSLKNSFEHLEEKIWNILFGLQNQYSKIVNMLSQKIKKMCRNAILPEVFLRMKTGRNGIHNAPNIKPTKSYDLNYTLLSRRTKQKLFPGLGFIKLICWSARRLCDIPCYLFTDKAAVKLTPTDVQGILHTTLSHQVHLCLLCKWLPPYTHWIYNDPLVLYSLVSFLCCKTMWVMYKICILTLSKKMSQLWNICIKMSHDVWGRRHTRQWWSARHKAFVGNVSNICYAYVTYAYVTYVHMCICFVN